MVQYDNLWDDINSLLSLLRSTDTVKLVDEYYQQYGNDAPAKLLELHIEDLQKRLDSAPHKI